ncbi:MAG: hypothetical protein ABW007_09025 [Chitinophagaceae bacterium]
MKKIFIFLVLAIPVSMMAQQRISKTQIEQFNKNLKQNPLLQEDADFTAAASSAKWAEESAVILCQKTVFNFDKKGLSAGKRIGRNLWGILLAIPTMGTSLIMANSSNETKIMIEETERRKILLRDKFAVEQYSFLYFRLSTEGDAFSARVIKKNGDIQPVEITDAARVDDIRSVPGTFRTYTDSRISISYRPDYFKVPVPDLEEGDIIEYEFKNLNSQSYLHHPNYKEFEPVYYVCNREMPVGKQIIEVVAEDDHYYIGHKSLKGAPGFTQTSDKGKKVFRWVDEGRDKLVDARYANGLIEQPSVKFQVVYARDNSKGFVWFNEKNDATKDISREELMTNVRKYWFNRAKYETENSKASSTQAYVDEIYKALKKSGITEASEDDYIRKAYYSIRGRTLYNNWRDMVFAKTFSGLLVKKKIPHEIIATTSNQRTQMDKVAFTPEIAWMIKCKGKYYSNPDEHLNPEDIPSYLAGNDCIRFSYDDEKSAASDVIPLSDTSANVIATQVEAKLDASMANLVIDKTVEAKGLVKDAIIDDILALTPFMETDYRNMDGTGMWSDLNGRDMAKAMEDFNKQKQEWKDEKPKMMKSVAEDEYGVKVENYASFRIQQDGRSHKKRSLRYNEDLTLGELTAVAGSDLIVSLPALMGGQAKIRKEERTRTLPVDLRYPRKILYHITLVIPSGYSVKGLENLNKELDNPVGSFSTTASVQGDKLVLDIRKIYKSARVNSSDWPSVLQILDAAYNFSQSKVILKKD